MRHMRCADLPAVSRRLGSLRTALAWSRPNAVLTWQVTEFVDGDEHETRDTPSAPSAKPGQLNCPLQAFATTAHRTKPSAGHHRVRRQSGRAQHGCRNSDDRPNR